MTDSHPPETSEVPHPPAIITSLATPTTDQPAADQPPVLITSPHDNQLTSPSTAGPISETNVHLPPSSVPGAELAESTQSAEEVPADKVNLTLLLASGGRKTFTFDPNDTVSKVKGWIYDNWPKEWAGEAPLSVASLNIILLGRYLEDSTTLEANKIPTGQTTIAHLTIKSSHGNDTNDSKSKESAPRCKMCLIL